ncbi:MAG: NAD-binding protein [Cyclobacteriaceae bacterium]
MNKSIAIIGAGQLGSRHLQALALLQQKAKLFVIDPDDASLKVAKERFEEVSNHELHECEYLRSLSEIHLHNLDLVVVATNAGRRSIVITELLSRIKVKFLILEKFLFQSEIEYRETEKLISESGTKCYVNCPRRAFSSYNRVKEILSSDESDYLKLEIVGNNWGLGCNGIHFVDLYHFLTNEIIEDYDNGLDSGYLDSKRSGYIDFTGELSSAGKNQRLVLTSFKEGEPNVSIRITKPMIRLVINETAGKTWIEKMEENLWVVDEIPFQMEYQSQLTNGIAEDLFANGKCKLTSLNESIAMHLPFLRTLLAHYNDSNSESRTVCPIT